MGGRRRHHAERRVRREGHVGLLQRIRHRAALGASRGRQRLAVRDLAPSVFPNLRYLTVTRRDKVRQAVSLWRALQTWSWSSEQSAARAAAITSPTATRPSPT